MYQISIEENLRRILTTTKGTMPLNANFGLSDSYIDRHLSQELQLALKDELLEQIRLYEPRISVDDIQIESKESHITLHINTQNQNLAIEIS